MIEVKSMPSDVAAVMAVDPGALGGWAFGMLELHTRTWHLAACGLSRTAKGERPPKIPLRVGYLCVGELPQHQKYDTPERTNDLFRTSCRLGLLAEATGADWFMTRTPHSWKNSVDKELHNARCLKRLLPQELEILKRATRGDGSKVLDSERNNVIDAIGIFLVTVGRW